MRMSRKRRRRLEKPAELAEPEERSISSFRMTRKRLRKRRESQKPLLCLAENLKPLENNFRMTRRRLRLKREAQRPSAAGALSLSLMFATSGLGEASSLSTMHEVPAEFQALRNAREEIINYRAVQRNLKNAQDNLLEAERSLNEARENREEANEGLMRARLNLEAAKAHLGEVKAALAEARAESERRTQLALQCQQAVADYLPNIAEQEASIQQLSAEESRIAGESPAGNEIAAGQVDELAARIEQAWESVDWQQNRIAEVQAMVAGAGESAAQTGEYSEAYQTRLEEISEELDRENNFLEEMYDYLDQLQEAQDRAEEAESEAREQVAELAEQQSESEAEIVQSQQELEETERWQAEAEQGMLEAGKNLSLAETELDKARYELEHFGESRSSQSSFEYYSWHGPERGHQLVLGQEFYDSTKKYDFGINFGYVVSHSGHRDGHDSVSGLTDTQLTVTLKNDHPVNEVHYELGINVPTGREAHVNAQLTEGLARYSSFNNGFIFTPAVEVRHRFNEKASVAARLSYSFRGDYQVSYTDGEGREAWEKISPGNQVTPEFSYLYAGEKDQYTIKAGYTHSNKTTQHTDTAARYRDGDSFWLKWYYNHDVNQANSWQVYAAYSRDGEASFFDGMEHPYNDSLSWYEFGLGWRHKWEKGQYLQLLLNYQKAAGNLYRYSTRGPELEENYLFSPCRVSATLIYGQKLSERDSLEIRAERYVISEKHHLGYNGWGLALMYNCSF